jgi:hypothetical protein
MAQNAVKQNVLSRKAGRWLIRQAFLAARERQAAQAHFTTPWGSLGPSAPDPDRSKDGLAPVQLTYINAPLVYTRLNSVGRGALLGFGGGLAAIRKRRRIVSASLRPS